MVENRGSWRAVSKLGSSAKYSLPAPRPIGLGWSSPEKPANSAAFIAIQSSLKGRFRESSQHADVIRMFGVSARDTLTFDDQLAQPAREHRHNRDNANFLPSEEDTARRILIPSRKPILEGGVRKLAVTRRNPFPSPSDSRITPTRILRLALGNSPLRSTTRAAVAQ